MNADEQTNSVDPATQLVGPDNRPARKSRADKRCPQCGADASKRRGGGFGVTHPICGNCGHEFLGERFDG